MLVIDPTKRISVTDALQHPFLKEFHCPEDEPTTERMHVYDFDFDYYDLTTEQLKDLLYEEVLLYHDDARLQSYLKDK